MTVSREERDMSYLGSMPTPRDRSDPEALEANAGLVARLGRIDRQRDINDRYRSMVVAGYPACDGTYLAALSDDA
jgi:hypothetical protein